MDHRTLLLLALSAAGCGDVQFEVNCTAADPSAEAKIPAGRQKDGSAILPGGRRVTPGGAVLDVGGFPLAMRVLPGDRYVVVTDGASGNEALRIVDLQAADPHAAVVSSYSYPITDGSPLSPALFYGMALTADGRRLYVSNGGYDPVAGNPDPSHYNTIDVFDIVVNGGSPPQLQRNDAATLKLFYSVTAGVATARLPSGIALSPPPNQTLLYVASQNDGSLAILDLTPGPGYGAEIGRAALEGVAPYDVVVDEASHTAFLSLWGGVRSLQPGSPPMVSFANGVALVDVTDPTRPLAAAAPVLTGKAAEAELLIGGKLLVANADADTVSTIDLASKAVASASLSLGGLIGSSPNALAVDGPAMRLYVADANENAVAVLDLASMASKGRIPTGWYPTAVAVLSDGRVVIASAKGLGSGPTDQQRGNSDFMAGVLQVLPKPSDAELSTGDKTVADNLARPRNGQTQLSCPASGEKRFVLPPDEKSPTPIKHVFLIVRENKTYDAVLGDQPGTNGEPSLAIFGASTPKGNVTPNLHALAAQFSNLDNFYANAEASLQGHEWTTASFSNDYTEKGWLTTWGRGYRPVSAFGGGTYENLPRPPTDTAWIHLDKANLPYHNYGEVTNTSGALHLFDSSYPGVFFNLDRKDVEKIQYVIDNLHDPSFPLEPFTYISLPDDHTYGTVPGKQTPESMVADNDEATGRLIDALSHSPYWTTSIVFIIEDDPADGGDHVEGHRSPCVVISPWVRHGYVSSVHYDDPALWRTINLLLGLPPMNAFDGNAAGMYDLFASHPDPATFTVIPRMIPEKLNGSDAPLSDQSARIDFTRPDSAPLGRILWQAMMGREPPWGATDSPRGTAARDDDD